MTDKVNKNKRKILLASTGFVGAIGGAGIGGSLLVSMSPSEKAKAAGAPVEVDISKIKPGTLQTVEWRGKPVWILNRTKEMMKSVEKENPRIEDPESKVPMQPKYAQNKYRSIKPNFLVLIGICTHLGCSPTEKLDAGLSSGLGSDWDGGLLSLSRFQIRFGWKSF